MIVAVLTVLDPLSKPVIVMSTGKVLPLVCRVMINPFAKDPCFSSPSAASIIPSYDCTDYTDYTGFV